MPSISDLNFQTLHITWLSFVSGRLLHRCQWALTLPHQFSLLHNGHPAHQEYNDNVVLLLLYVARCVNSQYCN